VDDPIDHAMVKYSIDAAERIGLKHYGLLINRSNMPKSLEEAT
jgi:hypothetical protein